jgi:hypothetical protein
LISSTVTVELEFVESDYIGELIDDKATGQGDNRNISKVRGKIVH